jgi:hypothetical protein
MLNSIVNIFSALGTFSIGCIILALTAAGLAFAGGCLGCTISTAITGREDAGVGRGLFLGCMAGLDFSLYCMYMYGMGTAFLAAIGFFVVVLLVAGFVFLFFPGPSLRCTEDGAGDDYPY